jgi:hypothetical protein
MIIIGESTVDQVETFSQTVSPFFIYLSSQTDSPFLFHYHQRRYIFKKVNALIL